MIPSLEILSVFIAVAGCLIASVSDLRTTRIPNRLTGSMLVFSFIMAILRMFAGEPAFIYAFLLNFGFGFAVGIVLWYLRAWSGGDAKLFWAVCALIPVYPPFIGGLINAKPPYYDNTIFGVTVLFDLAVILLVWFFFAALYRFIREKNVSGLVELMLKPLLCLMASFLFSSGLSNALGTAWLTYLAIPLALGLSILENASPGSYLISSAVMVFTGVLLLQASGTDKLISLFATRKSAFALTLIFSAYAAGSKVPLTLNIPINNAKKGMSAAEEIHFHNGKVHRKDVESSVWGRVRAHVNKERTSTLLVGPRPEGMTEKDLKELKRHEKALRGTIKVNISFPLTPFLLMALIASFFYDAFWLILN